jgi:RNA polymerase sigma-70 factor, ECF subfamily
MDKYSDEELFSKITESNQTAFEIIFLRFYADLCAYAQTILGNKDVSEEIVQDIFVKLWEIRESINIKSSLKGYLFRTVHNYCLNQIESWKVKEQYINNTSLAYYNNIHNIPFSGDYPIANLITQELTKQIKDSVEALPDQCREVFLLIRIKGLSYSEAAEKLNISVNTVKTQMSRAVAKLKDQLKEYLPLLWFCLLFNFL